MRFGRGVVYISVIDFIGFIVSWVFRFYRQNTTAVPPWTSLVYWLLAFLGLILAVWAFWAITRGRKQDFRRGIVSVLFCMMPGCVALVQLLSWVGSAPV